MIIKIFVELIDDDLGIERPRHWQHIAQHRNDRNTRRRRRNVFAVLDEKFIFEPEIFFPVAVHFVVIRNSIAARLNTYINFINVSSLVDNC